MSPQTCFPLLPPLPKEETPFVFLTSRLLSASREISKPLIPLGKAGVLLVQILILLCKEMVGSSPPEFTVEARCGGVAVMIMIGVCVICVCPEP